MRKISLYIGVIGVLALVFVIGLMLMGIRTEDLMSAPPEETPEHAEQAPQMPEQSAPLSK
jgi:hypothetical protein